MTPSYSTVWDARIRRNLTWRRNSDVHSVGLEKTIPPVSSWSIGCGVLECGGGVVRQHFLGENSRNRLKGRTPGDEKVSTRKSGCTNVVRYLGSARVGVPHLSQRWRRIGTRAQVYGLHNATLGARAF